VNRIAGLDLATERYARHQPLGIGMKLRAHPLAVGIAEVQLGRLSGLNERRGAYFAAVESGLKAIPGLSPFPVVEGGVRGGYYGFPILFDAGAAGCTRERFIAACAEAGLPAHAPPYPLLHLLPYFAEGFDLTPGSPGPLSGDYAGYSEGSLPLTESLYGRMMHLPVLSDPVPGAAGVVLGMLASALDRARR